MSFEGRRTMPQHRIPKYAHHSSGQARVRIDGKVIYLGQYGSDDSHRRYDDVIQQWLARRREARIATIDALALSYATYAEEYYRKDGRASGSIDRVRAALRVLVRLFGPEPIAEFDASKLIALQDHLATQGYARKYVNDLVCVVKQAFAWGVPRNLVPDRVLWQLKAVKSLAKGRSKARETEPVRPVPTVDIDAIEEHVARPVWSMVRLQLLTGMRPGEVLIMRPCDIEKETDGVWTYHPSRHKTEHHGKSRVVYLDSAAQDVLRPYLERDPESFCFSPKESDRRINGKHRVGNRYRRDSYRTAIQRACDRSGVPRWSPNQLRHNFGTKIRKMHGLEAARVLLGHSSAATSEIYAERDEQAARALMTSSSERP